MSIRCSLSKAKRDRTSIREPQYRTRARHCFYTAWLPQSVIPCFKPTSGSHAMADISLHTVSTFEYRDAIEDESLLGHARTTCNIRHSMMDSMSTDYGIQFTMIIRGIGRSYSRAHGPNPKHRSSFRVCRMRRHSELTARDRGHCLNSLQIQ